MENPFSGTKQFYSSGQSILELPVGDYIVRAFKGLEYEIGESGIQIVSGETSDLRLTLRRWIKMSQKGWHGSDGHLHIARPVPELNPYIARIMRAEDICIANLLQWGLADRFHNAIQYAHGPEGIYEEDGYILAPGQENPRTHFLGHSIILGLHTPIHVSDDYLIYRLFWERAKDQGGLTGHAHLGGSHPTDIGGQYGLPVVVPHNLLNFIEVMQFSHSFYDTWYDMLNLGFRITPTGGSDYPCGGATIPGKERFYTRIAGNLTYEKWLDSVGKGRTFVTNGPMLQFNINDIDIGEELILQKPGSVVLEGTVWFDSNRDDVLRIEVIENGVSVLSFPRTDDSGEIRFRVNHNIQETSWLALKASGNKIDEPRHWGLIRSLDTSAAHSAPVYVTIEGSKPIKSNPRAKDVARKWLARLEDLEKRLAEDKIKHLAERLAKFQQDVASEEVLRRDRVALIDEIKVAKSYFTKI